MRLTRLRALQITPLLLTALAAATTAAWAGPAASDTLNTAAIAPGASDTTGATPSRRALTADDFYRSEQLSEPEVSPDGAWVAYVVTKNDREADEPRSAVWMVSWDGKQRWALTQPASGTHAPRWSPDWRYLIFLATGSDVSGDALMLL